MKRLGGAFLMVLIVGVVGARSHAQIAPPEAIDASIERGKLFIYSQQRDGHWEDSTTPPAALQNVQNDYTGQWTGRTALAIYTLLAGGDSPNDPRLRPAIDFLKKNATTGTYALSMRCQVWSRLQQTDEVKAIFRKDALALVRGMATDGAAAGQWTYSVAARPTVSSYSHSRTQYAVLGLWAAAQSEIELPSNLWAIVEDAWIRGQARDGGWTYSHPDHNNEGYPTSMGMTAPGVATLFTTEQMLGRDVGCESNPVTPAQRSIDAGLRWIEQHIHLYASDEASPRKYGFSDMFSLERAALVSGLRYIGGIDWYGRGANWALSKQLADGSFQAGAAAGAGAAPQRGSLEQSCWAVLFLSRGRSPVAFAKLQYASADKPQRWNLRPQDLANLVRWSSVQLESDLQWQIVPIDRPAEDWEVAPILWISGDQALTFSADEVAKLKRFIEDGGLVIGHADCAARPFAESFRKLGQQMFPAREFRQLPARHPIYTAGLFDAKQWRARPQVLALSNDVRELMILLPVADPARALQKRDLTPRGRVNFELLTNIYVYAAGDDAPRRRARSILVRVPQDAPPPKKVVKLARLLAGPRSDPEPGAWRRLDAILRTRSSAAIELLPIPLGDGTLPASGATHAHLTGTAALQLDAAARAELKDFVESGGTLLVEAAGGRAEFGDPAEKMLIDLFGAGVALPEDSAIAKAVAGVEGGLFRRDAVNAARIGRETDLRAFTVSGRSGAVIFSPSDLQLGLVGTETKGVGGYAPEAAVRIIAAWLGTPLPVTPATKPATTRSAQ